MIKKKVSIYLCQFPHPWLPRFTRPTLTKGDPDRGQRWKTRTTLPIESSEIVESVRSVLELSFFFSKSRGDCYQIGLDLYRTWVFLNRTSWKKKKSCAICLITPMCIKSDETDSDKGARSRKFSSCFFFLNAFEMTCSVWLWHVNASSHVTWLFSVRESIRRSSLAA